MAFAVILEAKKRGPEAGIAWGTSNYPSRIFRWLTVEAIVIFPQTPNVEVPRAVRGIGRDRRAEGITNAVEARL
jgi:hypothetical protein